MCSPWWQQAVEKSRLFNSREGLFGKDLTEYDILGQINRAFEPFCTLWETAANWCGPPPPDVVCALLCHCGATWAGARD